MTRIPTTRSLAANRRLKLAASLPPLLTMSLLSDLPRLAKLNIYDNTTGNEPSTAQVAHRVELLKCWPELAGKSVFEVGCGQGDATAVLAAAVGEQGSVVGCDPASKDYGECSRKGEYGP